MPIPSRRVRPRLNWLVDVPAPSSIDPHSFNKGSTRPSAPDSHGDVCDVDGMMTSVVAAKNERPSYSIK
eukprot:1616023-Pyramimonas_sp.AAC.1